MCMPLNKPEQYSWAPSSVNNERGSLPVKQRTVKLAPNVMAF